MIGDTTREFVDNEVWPNIAAMEQHAWEVARDLVKKGGRTGLARCDHSRRIRRSWSRSDNAALVIAEMIGRGGGFGTTFGAQTSIGVAADPLFRF